MKRMPAPAGRLGQRAFIAEDGCGVPRRPYAVAHLYEWTNADEDGDGCWVHFTLDEPLIDVGDEVWFSLVEVES